MNNKLIYIITENFVLENNQKWIIDVITNEFTQYSKLFFTDDIKKADIIWIIGYNLEEIGKIFKLKNKPFIITTIHHIDWKNNKSILQIINLVDSITNKYHVICNKVETDLRTLTKKPIIVANFWINEHNFFNIKDKETLKLKYNIPSDKFIVGSFQRDTHGKSKCILPKLSKGPDILVNILKDIYLDKPNLLVLLTGRKRNYIINEFDKAGIQYIYHEMVNVNQLNELYNCLDLYIVSSRVEGGPRSIMECGLSKVPIISTDVGIAPLILHSNSIYDKDSYISYKQATPDIDFAYQNSKNYEMNTYIQTFIHTLFDF